MTSRQKRFQRHLAGSFLNDEKDSVPPPPPPVIDPVLEVAVRAQFASSTKIVQSRPQKLRVSLGESLLDLDNAVGLWGNTLPPHLFAVWKAIAVLGLTPQILEEWTALDLDEAFTIDIPAENTEAVARLFNPYLLDKNDAAKEFRVGPFTIYASRGYLRSSDITLSFTVEPLRPILEEIQKLRWSAKEFEEGFDKAAALLLAQAEFIRDLKIPTPSKDELTEKRHAQISALGLLSDGVALSPAPALRFMNPFERRVIPKWIEFSWNEAKVGRALEMSKSEVSRVVTGFLDRCQTHHASNPSRATEVFLARVVDAYEREDPDLEAAFALSMGGNCAAFGGATIRSNVHRGEFTFERWGKLHETRGHGNQEGQDGGEVGNDGWGDE